MWQHKCLMCVERQRISRIKDLEWQITSSKMTSATSNQPSIHLVAILKNYLSTRRHKWYSKIKPNHHKRKQKKIKQTPCHPFIFLLFCGLKVWGLGNKRRIKPMSTYVMSTFLVACTIIIKSVQLEPVVHKYGQSWDMWYATGTIKSAKTVVQAGNKRDLHFVAQLCLDCVWRKLRVSTFLD